MRIETVPLKNYIVCPIINHVSENYRTGRFERLLKNLNLDGLDDENKKELVSILRKYQSVFQVDGENLTTNNFYKQNVY